MVHVNRANNSIHGVDSVGATFVNSITQFFYSTESVQSFVPAVNRGNIRDQACVFDNPNGRILCFGKSRHFLDLSVMYHDHFYRW